MTKTLRRVSPTESQIQCAIVEWGNRVKIPDEDYMIGDFLVKIPNEGKRSFSLGKKMKMEGLKKGISDLFLAYPASRSISAGCACCYDPYERHGLWIEVKSAKGRPSKEQHKWLNNMIKTGYAAVVVKGVEEGIQAIKDYLGIK